MRQNSTKRQLQFENDRVRVWKTVLSPNETLPENQQGEGRVVISLSGETPPPTEKSPHLGLEPHTAYWLGADPINTLGANKNLSKEPIEVMVVEMKGPKDTTWPSIPID